MDVLKKVPHRHFVFSIPKILRRYFLYDKVLKMLLSRGKITEEMTVMLSTWRHSGFNVFCGNRISPIDDTAMEHLARYIIRASFSQSGSWSGVNRSG